MKKVINHPSFRYLLFGFSLLFLFISFYDYNRISEKHIETEMIEITGENNQLINGAITNKIKDQLEILQNYAKLIAYHEISQVKKYLIWLEPLTKEDLFTNVAITTLMVFPIPVQHIQAITVNVNSLWREWREKRSSVIWLHPKSVMNKSLWWVYLSINRQKSSAYYGFPWAPHYCRNILICLFYQATFIFYYPARWREFNT